MLKSNEKSKGQINQYFKEFNSSEFDLKRNSVFIQNGLISLENKFQDINNCIKKNEPFYVVAGINPYVKLHLGHKFLSSVLDYFLDEQYSRGYLIIPEKEMSLMGRKFDGQDNTKDFLNLLRNKDKVDVRKDSSIEKFGLIELMYSKYSIGKLKKIFKIGDDDKIGKSIGILYAIGNYFIPNLDNKTNIPTLILANEKHKNFLMYSNHFSKYIGLQKISSLVLKDVPGRNGSYKMSASKNKTIISLEDIEKDFLKTITSGRINKLEQYRKGGNPENCYSLKIGEFFNSKEFISDLSEKCRNGGNSCYKCKEKIVGKMIE